MHGNRFFARKSGSTVVTPPAVVSPEFVGGWAGTYNGGVGVTGGGSGTLKTYSNAIQMLEELMNSQFTAFFDTPERYLYTGPSNIDIGGITNRSFNSQVIANKTVMCSEGQNLFNGEIRFTSCENILARNISRVGYTHHHGDFYEPSDESVNRDGFTFNSCLGVHVDHCHLSSGNYDSGIDKFYYDGLIDANLSNRMTFSNCVFELTDRGILLGYSDSSTNNGLLKTTIRNCILRSIRQRQPLVRKADLGFHQNLVTWIPRWKPAGISYDVSYGISVRTQAKVWMTDNYFDNGDRMWIDNDTDAVKTSGIRGENNKVVGPWNGTYDSLFRSELVTWPETTPLYQIPLTLNPDQAKAYAETWAGAKFHLKYPIV